MAVLLVFGYGCGDKKSTRNMLDSGAQAATLRQFLREGVALTVRESAGFDRVAEPVTSGVPLPEGAVSDPVRLTLANADGHPVPCQFAVQSRWPDGSAKWVLLDFQTTVASNAVAPYTLSANAAAPPPPDRPVEILREDDNGIALGNGRLRLTFDKTRPGLISAIEMDGESLVLPDRPIGTALVNEEDISYHASAPDRLEIEHRGPMRTVVRVGGHYVAEDGSTIHDGKVGYDLRVSVYADKPWIGLDFTLRNDGWYGYRNESQRRRSRPRQWLHIRSLSLDAPVALSGKSLSVMASDKRFPLGKEHPVSFAQWYKYPFGNIRRYRDVDYGPAETPPHEAAAGMSSRPSGYYRVWRHGEETTGRPGSGPGRIVVLSDGAQVLAMFAFRFRENFPGGFSVAPVPKTDIVRASYDILPEGGCWPRTPEAFAAQTYQFEGGRRKTWTVRLDFGNVEVSNDGEAKMNMPLLATVDTAWHKNTGAVSPLDDRRIAQAFEGDESFAEAAQRYNRLQLAKVRTDAGDPAGKTGPLDKDLWGRVSIPDLWERHPAVFAGWMNFGDLVWSHGYCSLFYDWSYSMLVQYLRLGDRAHLDVANVMVRHRYDIDQYHVEDTATWLGGFQRYEKGEHGHLDRQTPNNTRWEMNARPSHTWNRGLLLHWALTGDPRSLDAAEQNGRAYRRFFYNQHKLHEKETLPWREFRTPGWAIENWLALYEYTGKSEYLAWAEEIFDKSLLAMERENGSKGHILPEGRQDARFTAYIVEPVIRLHHHSGRKDIVQFVKRVLDWQRHAGTIRGFEKDGIYWPLLWRSDWDYKPDLDTPVAYGATHHYNLLFADGYAWLYNVLGRKEDRDFARQLFTEFMFYYMTDRVENRLYRTPLGYHHLGCPLGFASKLHALTGRYGLLCLNIEQQQGSTP